MHTAGGTLSADEIFQLASARRTLGENTLVSSQHFTLSQDTLTVTGRSVPRPKEGELDT